MLPTKKFLDDLRTFEKDVPAIERARSDLLERLRAGEPDAVKDLENMLEKRRELREGLEQIGEALRNSAATFARFEAKCVKDQALLVEARKRAGAPAFGDKDPILAEQRAAFTRLAQKLVFVQAEIEKLAATLRNKYSLTRNFPELAKLSKALQVDLDSFDDMSSIGQMIKQSENMAVMHHLST